MKIFVIFVAVLLTVKAATVPQDVTHQVTVPLPGNVLAVAKDVDVAVPAVVVEVSKDHKHNPDEMEQLVATNTESTERNPELSTGNPVVMEVTSEVLGVQSSSSEGSGSGSVVTRVLPLAVTDNPIPVVDGRLTLTAINEGQLVSTMIPMVDDMMTHGLSDSDDTTLLPDSEGMKTDITTIVSDSEDITTDVTGIEEVTLTPMVPMAVEEVVNIQELSVVTPSKPQEQEIDTDMNSNNDTTDKHSEEDSSEEVSSSSTENSHAAKQPQLHNHIGKDDSMPSVSLAPPITEDITASQSDSSSSSEEVKPTLIKVPLEADTVVIRRRRAIPFIDPTVVISPTGPPKLATNPKVIAEILAKSKNLQKRYKKSIKVEKETVPTMDVPLITKTDNAEDPPATIDPCDLLCTKFEFEPICGSNGLCLHEFSNQCMLDTYNCKHPRNKFLATKDDRCQMHWLDFCSEEEML